MARRSIRRSAVSAIALLATTSACADSAEGDSPTKSTPTTSELVGVVPAGFELITVTITPSEGKPVELTMWFAGTPLQWNRGLTDVTDLGDADGMLFAFDEPADYQFYMWQTPVPLDIVFFDAAGAFAGRVHMPPCREAMASQCPRYSPGVPFQSAIEMPAGSVDTIAIDEQSTIRFETPESKPTSTT